MTKLDVNHIVIVIYIYFKFHEIPLSGYFVVTVDERTDRWKTDGRMGRRTWTKLYPYAFGGE